MKETEDPVRWLAGGDDAPAGFAALVAKDNADLPSSAELAKSFGGLARELGRPELVHALELARGATGATLAGHAGLYVKLALSVALGVAGAGVLWRLHASQPQPSERPPARAVPSSIAASPVPATPAMQADSPRSNASPAPVAASAPPVPAQAANAAPVRSRGAARTTRAASATDPGAELALLERTQRALRTDPALALALAEQHKQRFAAGQFEPEREMLAIEALVRLGRGAAARERGRRFLKAHPQSSYRPRLEDLLAGAK